MSCKIAFFTQIDAKLYLRKTYTAAILQNTKSTSKNYIQETITDKGVAVYPFGSRATSNAAPFSDIDLGILLENSEHCNIIITCLRKRNRKLQYPLQSRRSKSITRF